MTQGSPVQTEIRPVPPTQQLGAVPAFALDGFTRPGKAALAALIRENADVRQALDGLAPDRRWLHLVASALFYAEGQRTRLCRRWPLAVSLERLAIDASALSDHRTPADFDALTTVITHALPHLNQIRARLLGDAPLPDQQRLLSSPLYCLF